MKPNSTTASGIIFSFVFFSLFAFSCKKSNSPAAAGPLQVSAISPMEGPGGTTVTIRGAGFSATPGADSVYVNGKAAAVIFADDSILQVTVPALAGTGSVSVKVRGTIAAGPSFTYDYQGMVSTYAGTAGTHGAKNGSRTSATFYYPWNLAVDGSGNLYVADYGNGMVREIAADGTVSTLLVTSGGPAGVALDGKGNLYVSVCTVSPQILQVSLATGNSSVLSGNGSPGHTNSTSKSQVEFSNPAGLAVDQKGNVYVADVGNQLIRAVTSTGAASTFAGDYPNSGAINGAGNIATFSNPFDLVFDAAGNLYVADANNDMIRKITPDTVVSTFAGAGNSGFADGTGVAAGFNSPIGIAIDGKGNLFVADGKNNLIRMITPSGTVTTIAGSGNVGSADGIGAAASFNGPQGITCDANGNLFLSDNGNFTIRKITIQ